MALTITLRTITMLGLLSALAMLPGSRADPTLCDFAPIGYESSQYKYVDCQPAFEEHDEIEACCVVWPMYETRCQNPKPPVEEGVDLQLTLMDMVQKDAGGNPFENSAENSNWRGEFGLGTTAIPNRDVYPAWWLSWMQQDEDFIPITFDFRVRTKGYDFDSTIRLRHSCPPF